MPEIKPLNLSTPAYNPLGSVQRQESWQDKMRKNSQVALQQALGRYQIKGLQRAEKDYNINKRAENFLFGNYPDGRKADLLNPTSFKFLGEGQRSEALKNWKENVGGNMQAFEQYWQAGKQAELDGIKRNLMRDPAKYGERAWSEHVTNTLTSMDPADRQSLMGSLDDQTLGALNQYYDPERFMSWGEWGGRVAEENPLLGGAAAVAGGAAAIGGVAALIKRGKLKEAAKLISEASKKGGGGGGSLKSLPLQKQIGAGSPISIGSGAVKSAASAGRLGGKPPLQIPSSASSLANQAKGLNPKMQIPANYSTNIRHHTVVNDVINPNQVGNVQKAVSSLIKDGKLTQSTGDQLMGVVKSLKAQGQTITTKNVYEGIKRLGTRGGSLMHAVNSKKLNLGPLKGMGLMKSIGVGMGAGLGLQALTEVGVSGAAGIMGASDETARKAGEIAGVPAGTAGFLAAPHVYQKIADVVKKKGAPYVLKRIAAKGGPKLAARLAAKGVLGGLMTGMSGPVGIALTGALVAGDVYTIYNILNEVD